MTDNEKIARWAGVLDGYRYTTDSVHGWCYFNDKTKHVLYTEKIRTYSTDSEAVELLNVLVGKGYEPELSYCSEHWSLNIFTSPKWVVENVWQPTIHQAITAAVLKLIEKEGGECSKTGKTVLK